MKYREPFLFLFLSLASLGLCQGGGRFGINSKPFGSSFTSSSANNGPYVNKAISSGGDGQYHSSDDGQYHPSGDDGQYHPTDEGRYIPDDSGAYSGGDGEYVASDEGRYYPSNEGQYVPDNFGEYLASSSGSGTGQYRAINQGQFKSNNGNYAAVGTGSKIPSSTFSAFPSGLSSKPSTDFKLPVFQTRPASSVSQTGTDRYFQQPTNAGINRPIYPSTSSGREPGLNRKLSTISFAPTTTGLSNTFSTFSFLPSTAISVTGGKISTFPSTGFEPKSGLGSINRPSGKFQTFSPVPSGPKLDLSRPFITSALVPFRAKPGVNGNTPALTAVNGPNSKLPTYSPIPSETVSGGKVFPTFPASGGSNGRIPLTSITFSGHKPNFSGKLSTFPSAPGTDRRSYNKLPAIPSFSSEPIPQFGGKTSTNSIGAGFGGPIHLGITGTSKQLPVFASVSPKPIFGGKTSAFPTAPSITGVNGPGVQSSLGRTIPKFPAAAVITGPSSILPTYPLVSESKSPLSGKISTFPSVSNINRPSNKFSVLPASPTFRGYKPSTGAITAVTGGQFRPDNEGQYKPDGSGAGNGGQYRPLGKDQHGPDNSGNYGPGGSSIKFPALSSSSTFGGPKPSTAGRVSGGQYSPNNEGQYKPVGSDGGSREQYRPSDQGQYRPDSFKNYGSGKPNANFLSLPSGQSFGGAKTSPVSGSQYRPTSEGQYKPNSSGGGQYRHSGDSNYKPNNFGNYGSGGGQYRPSGDSQYKHDDSGSYRGDSGQYVPDESGKYVHDDRKYEHQDVGGGAYKHQPDSGDKYRPDNSGGGEYKHQPDKGDKYRPDNSGGGDYIHQPDKGDKYRPDNSGGGNYKHQPDRGDKYRPDNSGNTPFPSGPSKFGLQGGEKLSSGVCSYESLRNYKIIRQKGELHQDNYHYLYETENCMYGEERGQVHNKGKEDEVMRAEGIFYYVGPDKVKYTVTYTADENGFIPHGDHIPTPPPIPAAILRSLEYKRSIGEL